MIVNRFSELLKNISNRKFRNSYIKYLMSLDFEEFYFIYNHYSKILIILSLRYKNKKRGKFISWIKLKILYHKFEILYKIFNLANKEFIKKTMELNNKKYLVLNEIITVKTILKKLETVNIIINNNKTNIINVIAVLILNVYNKNKLEELEKKLNDLNQRQNFNI